MPLAHTATSGGPNTEILLLGAGALVLAIVFFVQKSASRRVSVVLAVAGVAAITGAFTLSGDPAEDRHVSIAIAAPRDGATVEAGTVPVEVRLSGAELAGDGSGDDTGHLHVYVDGAVVDMPSALEVEVEMKPGAHEIEVEFVDADHTPLDPPVTDSVTVTAE